MTKPFAVSIKEEELYKIRLDFLRRNEKIFLPLVREPMIAGFIRKKGTYNNLWRWGNLEDVKM